MKTKFAMAVSVIGICNLAQAQSVESAGADDAKAKRTNRFLEVVVVTAQKRTENAQDVPIAIAAFSEEKLDAFGIQSTADLPSITPGLTITGSAGFNLIYLRGIGTSAFIPSFDPSVATYVDGIYIPSQQATLTDLGGVERVEVLKGPQGTLFGRNSTGGAISVFTKSPGVDPEMSIGVERGSFDAKKAKFYASYPILDSLAVSLAGIYSTVDSYYDVKKDPESLTGQPNFDKLDAEVTRGGRFSVKWFPVDSLDVTLTGYYIEQRGSIAFVEPNVKPAPITGVVINPPGDYEWYGNTEPVSHSRTAAVYSNINWQTPLFDVKVLGAYQKLNSYDNVYDFDGSSLNLAIFNGAGEPSDLKSAEIQFISNDEGLTPSWLRWVGGLYYLTQEAGFDPFYATVGNGVGLEQALQPVVETLQPILNNVGLDFSDLAAGDVISLGAQGMLETNSYSVFAQGTADITSWLSITAGARYQEEDRFLTKQNTLTYLPGVKEPIPTLQFNQPKVKQTNVSPKLTFEFRPLDGLLLYATWAKGFKSGSYNVVTLYTVPGYVEPEEVTSVEIGGKISIIDGLALNFAVFNNEIKDLQETKLSLLSGGAISAENAGAARTRGAEFDFTWVPLLDWNPGLVVNAGATYLEANYTDYQNASGFDEDTGLPFGSGAPEPSRDFSGNKIARTPDLSANFSLSQTFDIPGGPLELSGDMYYNSGFFFSQQNSKATEQESYMLFNARVSYLYEDLGLRISAFGKNLSEEKYAETSLTVDFGTFERLAPPRTYGLRLSYDY
ncbi:MAG: TonB-dependent receptor [Zhongshania sp.]|uniref:TonB-dependent receptor n=1 Tax=Zhongshania sp. TaxID=1971902 RepID=UPI00260F7433|nr:TonB-dependent receptor [Zhongshania sp.]MDF1690851.1 TonB-dependent receptor [Zhongshania sp.]